MTEEQAAALLESVSDIQATLSSNADALETALAQLYILLCLMFGAFLAFALVYFLSHFFRH